MSKELGIRLYYLRTHKTTWTHQQVAEMLKLERSTYTKYENGDSEPSLDILAQLKRLFDVSYEELIEPKLTEAEIADYKMRYRRTKI